MCTCIIVYVIIFCSGRGSCLRVPVSVLRDAAWRARPSSEPLIEGIFPLS